VGALLARDELDVVDHQDVDGPVAVAEVLGPLLADGVDQLVGERLGGDVADPQFRGARQRPVTDGVQQVGLTQPHTAVDVERVELVGRAIGDRERRGVGQPVVGADDELLKDVAGVEAMLRRRRQFELLRNPHDRGRRPTPGCAQRRGVRALGRRGAAPGTRRPAPTVEHGELHRDLTSEDQRQRVLDLQRELVAELLDGEAVRRADGGAVVLEADDLRVAQPGLEVGPRERLLQIAQGGLPQLFGLHRNVLPRGFPCRATGTTVYVHPASEMVARRRARRKMCPPVTDGE